MALTTPFIKTWIMPLAGGVPTWDDSTWYVEDRLIPVRSNRTPGSMGTASFRLMRRSRNDDKSSAITSSWQPIRGQYVAITTQACTGPGQAGTLWVGYIEDYDTSPLKYIDDEIGSVSCRELGGILRQVPLANPRVYDLTLVSPDGIALNTLPTANSEGYTQGEVIGNAYAAPAGVQPAGYTRYQWAAQPSDCGTSGSNYWSRWALIDHFAHWNYSPILPSVMLSAPSNVKTLLTTSAKEVFKLSGLKFDGLLNLMCGASRGLQWWITVSSSVANTWVINIASAIDVAVGSIPAATLTTANIESTDVSVRLSNSGFDIYDAVEINGNAIVFAGTVSPIDATAAAGWSSTSETDYKAGASGAAGYGALTNDQKLARNRMYRKSGLLADVYTRFLVAQDSTYQFQCKGISGLPVAGTVQFFCPLITWSGTTAAVDNTHNMAPYPPDARLLRQLPWSEGVQGDGTDLRSAEQKARPKYLEPVVLSYQVPGSPTDWSNLVHPPFKYWHAPSLTPDPRGPALRIEFEYPEMLAAVDWTSGSPAVTEYDPTLSSSYGASDWRKLVFTVAMASDQRVKVASYRSGVSSSTYRNPLRIERPDIHCWVVRKYSILGLKTDGTPDEVSADAFVRNDFAVAQKLADEAAAFAFRTRSASTIVLTQPWNPPGWADIGITIGDLNEQKGGVTQITRTLHTSVTDIEYNWDVKRPRIAVTTGDAALPDSTAIVALTPAFGGPVSTSLGMTLPATVQRIDTELKDVQKSQERVPIKTGRLPVSTTPTRYVRIRWAPFPIGSIGTIGDFSEGQEVDSTGANVSPTHVVWIDTIGSCRPEWFGAVYYEAVSLGTVTRNSSTRELFRAIKVVDSSGPSSALFEVEGAGGGSTIVQLNDSGHASINTTINGVANPNYFELVGGLTAGTNRYDCARKAIYRTAHTVSLGNYLQIVPDHFQTGRKRMGLAAQQFIPSGGGVTTVNVATQIDQYELFELHWGNHAEGTFGSPALGRIASSYGAMVIKNTGSAVEIYGFRDGVLYEKEGGGTSDDWATGVNTTWSASGTFTFSVYIPGASDITTITITVTPTFSHGQITNLGFSIPAGGGAFNVVFIGGRPAWTGE